MGGNWKLNPTTVKSAETLASEVSRAVKDIHSVGTVVFPPFPLLPIVKAKLHGSNVMVCLNSLYWCEFSPTLTWIVARRPRLLS